MEAHSKDEGLGHRGSGGGLYSVKILLFKRIGALTTFSAWVRWEHAMNSKTDTAIKDRMPLFCH